ncbi:MAG: SLBB domain-containing protein [candidate division KSB1 bacterium]|nr:SLBB domain-containing protein [candidate division KSB1 bacterium]
MVQLHKTPTPYDQIQALEGTVSDSEYVVGPGDVFLISSFGTEPWTFESVVTPEGKLVLPSLAVLDVGGKKLAEVKALVSALNLEKYRLARLSVILLRLRPIRVHVLGEIQNPDTYVASTIDRVSRLIQMAGGFTPWSDRAHVQIRHQDGTVDTLDYVRYLQRGDLSQNSYVRDGDVIYVPAIDLRESVVRLEGINEIAGYYRLRPGQTVWEFVRSFSPYLRMVDPQDIYVERTVNGRLWRYRVDLFGSDDQGGVLFADSPLMPGDVVQLPVIQRDVYVSGAVQNPGNLPFMPGFRALDYVGMAGGSRESANVRALRVYHRRTGKWATGPNEEVERGDFIFLPETPRRRWIDYLSITSGIASIVLAAKAIGVI